jgi:hypothetical protein
MRVTIKAFGKRIKRGWEVDTAASRICTIEGFGVNYHYPINNS